MATKHTSQTIPQTTTPCTPTTARVPTRPPTKPTERIPTSPPRISFSQLETISHPTKPRTDSRAPLSNWATTTLILEECRLELMVYKTIRKRPTKSRGGSNNNRTLLIMSWIKMKGSRSRAMVICRDSQNKLITRRACKADRTVELRNTITIMQINSNITMRQTTHRMILNSISNNIKSRIIRRPKVLALRDLSLAGSTNHSRASSSN